MRHARQGIALTLTAALWLVVIAPLPAGAGAETGEIRAITYAPRDDAPKKMRVMGESRSVSGGPTIAVLAPDEAGGTALAQPTLHWFVSEPISSKVALTITDEKSRETVFETVMDGPPTGGVVSVQLGKLRVWLRSGRFYRWSIAVLNDADQLQTNLFASGVVRRTDLDPNLAAQLNRTASREMPFFLAENGLWYDALAVLSAQIAREPEDRALRGLRASLLDQVGLYDVAKFDRQ